VQPGWIAYALMTDQLGFVIGCGISTGVQLSAYLRANGAIGRAGAVPVVLRRGSRFGLPAGARSGMRSIGVMCSWLDGR
jgi:hypothetical protein